MCLLQRVSISSFSYSFAISFLFFFLFFSYSFSFHFPLTFLFFSRSFLFSSSVSRLPFSLLFLPFPILTKYHTTDNSNIALILIYISYFGDFAGRQLTLLPKKVVWNQTSHLISAIFRFLWVPGIVVYIKQDYWWNDWFVYVFIGTFAVIGGYIRTLIFTIGPQVVSLEVILSRSQIGRAHV